MAYKLTASTIANLAGRHKDYWDRNRGELYRLKQCYETRIWDHSRGYESRVAPSEGINIEVPVGYEHIEGVQAALFTRQPGCVVRAGLTGHGSPEKAEALLNNWTARNRQVIESASRLALIYPMSFVKLAPQEHTDPLRRVTSAAVCPWDVIVDRDAQRWDEQRYCGHIYFLPVPDAKERFGNKQFEAGERQEYWDQNGLNADGGAYSPSRNRLGVGSPSSTTEEEGYFQFIKIVELYDFVNDRLMFWSPNWKSGDELLDSGPIPFRNPDGSPANNIIPFYYNHIPDKPLDGYSSLRRIYDQCLEMNIIRSFQANAVRKASRQWLVRKGALDEDQMSQLIAGIDGAYVEVDTENLADVMRAVPHTATPPELESYYNAVRADKDRGSIMAPFTRGEATRSSATEIAALVAYTSSEIGRMARERDEMIEMMCRAVLNMYRVYLGAEPVTLFVKGKYISVNGNEIADDFNIYSEDNASTPVSDAIRKSELLGATNLLIGLGVPQPEMLKELVRTLNLPESFLMPLTPVAGAPPPLGTPGANMLPSAGPAASAAASGSGAGSPAALVSSILETQRK